MQAVHELGHIIGAQFTGGQVTRVVLHPLTISRTDVVGSEHPAVVVWLGPVIGIVVPLLVWAVGAAWGASWTFLARFFAGFCLVANGLYIGVGAFDRVGDCGDMLRHGAHLWQLWLFGVIAVPLGLSLWHRQGRHFGFGSDGIQVTRGAACGSFIVCVTLLLIGFIVGDG